MSPVSPAEARGLGRLMEQARTVPVSSRLSLKAVVSGCYE